MPLMHELLAIRESSNQRNTYRFRVGLLADRTVLIFHLNRLDGTSYTHNEFADRDEQESAAFHYICRCSRVPPNLVEEALRADGVGSTLLLGFAREKCRYCSQKPRAACQL